MEQPREFSYNTKQENKYKGVDNAPTIIKVISILHYINAGLYILVGLALIVFMNYFLSIINSDSGAFGLQEIAEIQGIDDGTFKISVIVMGFMFIGLAVLNFFVARDLWRLKAWARIVAVIIAFLFSTAQVYNMISGATMMQIINLAINIFIIGYLLFFHEAKEAFRK